MKEVSFLLEKHRGDIWLDTEEDVWFYDAPNDRWQVLVRDDHWAGFYLANDGSLGSHVPSSEYGPYRRLHKGAPR